MQEKSLKATHVMVSKKPEKRTPYQGPGEVGRVVEMTRLYAGHYIWVCGSYDVHQFNGPGLRCAPPTCVVHHQPALCTMVHKGDL